ncbi:MAG: coenzyme F420-0:L-glutamate ligase [Vulcanisaeta sp.]
MAKSIHHHNHSKERKNRFRILPKLYRRSFNYWYPGTNAIRQIVSSYKKVIDSGDFLIISEKALAIAYGNIYDEDLIKDDIFTRAITMFLNRCIFAFLLRKFFREKTIHLLIKTPSKFMTAHKKLALKYGGFLHFIKPVSEAGIDTKNLPYHYVALPLRNPQAIAKLIHDEFLRRGKYINVLIIDSDRSLKLKGINNLVISTRSSSIKGVIDLGGIGYLLSKILRRHVRVYPTPIAYEGVNIGLPLMLKLSKAAIKVMGEGFGKDAYDMLQYLGKKDFNDVTWLDMRRIRHYPAVLVKVKFVRVE